MTDIHAMNSSSRSITDRIVAGKKRSRRSWPSAEKLPKCMPTSTAVYTFMAFVVATRGLYTVLQDFANIVPAWSVSSRRIELDIPHIRRSQQPTPKVGRPKSQKFVIASRKSSAEVFELRHLDMDGDRMASPDNSELVSWFPSVDGMDQAVLDEWADITKLPKLNASNFHDTSKAKEGMATPHVVGCYLSHWRLLQKAWNGWRAVEVQTERQEAQDQYQSGGETSFSNQERKPDSVLMDSDKESSRPDMLFVFEDDAHCVSNLTQRTWEVVQKLPKDDWDLLFIGGKPFAHYTNDMPLSYAFRTNNNEHTSGAIGEAPTKPPNDELVEGVCQGRYGKSSTGPFAPTCSPDGTTCTSEINYNQPLATDQPFWRTKYILNTNAYVVNPRRIERILRVLSAPMDRYTGVDVFLANDMWRDGQNVTNHDSFSSPLKVFMPTRMFCDQESEPRIIEDRDNPPL